jgi:hypothetical protein
MRGNTSHPKKIIAPAKIIKISTKNPINIKKLLTTAPKIREIKLEKKASRYLLISKPLP